MSNKITASITFSFRGKVHSPSLEFDLDRLMTEYGRIPDLYPLIARANDFDLYSYEYEMMQAEPVQFSNANGMVTKHVKENNLDIESFESDWRDNKLLEQLQKITAEAMSIDNLKQHPELLDALRQAYQLGKNNTPESD